MTQSSGSGLANGGSGPQQPRAKEGECEASASVQPMAEVIE